VPLADLRAGDRDLRAADRAGAAWADRVVAVAAIVAIAAIAAVVAAAAAAAVAAVAPSASLLPLLRARARAG